MTNKNYFSQAPSVIYRRLVTTLLVITCFVSNVLNAQVTVNPGAASYPTVSAAFTAINAGTHTGAVTIAISANTTEPATPVVLAASGVGAANYTSIDIYPTASGVVVSNTSSASRGVLEFNGADYITINGNINNGTGTTRDLTIRNNATTTNAHSVLWFQGTTTSPALGCTNIVVKNTILQGNGNLGGASGTTTYSTGIAFVGTTFPSSTTVGANHQNITITNNSIKQVNTGIHIGNTSGTPALNIIIENNQIGSATASEYVYFRGIWMAHVSGSIIRQNHIFNIKPTLATQSLDRNGIEITGASTGVMIDRNEIHGIETFSSTGYAGFGINISTGLTGTITNFVIVNNLIYDIQGYGWNTQVNTPIGIRVGTGTGHKIYYNSINLFGNTTGTGTTLRNSAALAVALTTVTGLDIRNNIFSNTTTATGVATSEHYAMWFAASYNFGTAGNTINNNAFFVSPSLPNHYVGKVGTTAGTLTYQTLAAWQAISLGDAQSVPVVNLSAPFTSNTNLTIPAATSTGCESGGVAIASLGLPNTDYTGVNRPAGTGTAPDMGAYEFEGVATTGCTGTPANGGTTSASSTSICSGSGVTVSATGYTSDIGIQYNWQSASAVGGPFTDIGGATTANTYPTGALTSDTYYRLRVTCSNSSLSNYSTVIGITVNNPQLSSTAPATRCGAGTVTLGATPSSGTVNWYTALTGGTPIATGNSYTTPSISSTTTYYATASSGGTTQTSSNGVPNVSTTTTNGGLEFTLNTNVILNYIQVYSVNADNLVVTLENSSNTVLFTSPSLPIVASTLAIPQTLNLGWSIPAGVGYHIKIAHTAALGYSSGAFPAPMGNGVGTITNGWLASSTSTLNYFVYNMNTTSGCESSPRTAVAATVTPAPTISPATNMTSVCSGGAVNLSVTSSNDPNYNYTWTSTPAGFNATGASVNANPAVTTTYNVTANDPGTQCQALGSIAVTALPAAPTITASQAVFCITGGSSTLTLSPSTGYPAGSIQWQTSSSSGGPYTDISGATSVSYVTPVIAATTYYKALIKDANGTICQQPTITITLSNPQLTGTTGDTRCGYGTVNLSATGTAGSIGWYNASTGGQLLSVGNTYSPTVSATTNFYAAARDSYSPALTTSFLGNLLGYLGSPPTAPFAGGNMFDVVAVNTITINSFDVHLNNDVAFGPSNLSLYYKTGTYVGFTTTAGAWTLLGTANGVTSAGYGVPTALPIPINLTIPAGQTYAFYVVASNLDVANSLRYNTSATSPAVGAVAVSDANVQVLTGTAIFGPFTTAVASPVQRLWNGRVHYTYACESPRTLVTATVTPAPSITAATTTTAICPGGSADVSVTSPNDPNYSYAWTSSPAGYTASGAGPHTVSPTVTTKYYVTATDNSGGASQGCGMIDSVTITNGGSLVAGTITSSQNAYCLSGGPVLTSTGASGGARQWQSSTISSSGPWTNVGAGATTYSPGTITQTTYYQMVTSCQASSVTSNVTTVTVNNPTLTSTTPGTRCGTGTVTLGATTSAASINWYSAASGGTAIATGNSFTTPIIGTTTNYYASAVSAGGSTQISSNGVPTVTTSTQNGGLQFTLNVDVVLNSIQVYSTAAGTATVTLENSANAVLFTSSAMPIVASNLSTPQTLTLGWPIAAGVGYHIKVANTGNNLGYASGAFPAPMGNGVGTITSGWLGSATNSLNYFVYNMNTTSGCESARTAISATVIPAPALNIVAGDLGLCNGGSTTLSVSSANDPNYTYSWTSAPAGFVQSGNGPFTITPSTTTKYYVDALDNSGGANNGCVKRDSVTVTVTGVLTAGTASSSVSTLCVSGTPTMILAGYDGSIQWQSSTVSATGPWTNVGTGLATYTPGAPITQTTYYQAVVSCSGSSVISNAVTVTVNNPQITGTTPNSRCGAGTTTLGATASVGASINWYASASGGSPIGSGTTFTTPVINTTTNFYAAANNGFTTYSNTVGYSTSANYNFITQSPSWGLMFTANVACTFDSVAVFPTGTGTISIKILDVNNNILFNGPTVNISGVNGLPKVFVPIGATLSPGNYKIGMAYTGVTNLGSQPTGGSFAYPFVSSIATITSGTQGSGAVAGVYYWFYDLSFSASTGCEGVRAAVPATVTPSPNISASATFLTPCSGNPTSLSVSSSNDPNYTYTWTSTPAGYNQTGAGPLTATPSVTTTYNVLAIDNTGGTYAGCGATTNITITPTANPLSVSAAATPPSVCPGQNAQLLAAASTAGYTMNANCTASFIDISSTGTAITGITDDSEHNLTIPSFTFNGIAYTTARLGTNGTLVFGSTTGDITTANAALPSTANTAGNVFVAPYWDDLDINMGGTMYTQTVGSLFIVQWHNLDHNLFTTGTVRFQLQLNLSTGQISFVYPDVVFGSATYDLGLTATVGIQFSSTSAMQYSFNTASLTNGQSICFSPSSAVVTYDWTTNPTFLNFTNIDNPIAQAVNSSQTYTVIVTQTSTGCTKSATVPVTLKPAPDPSANSNAPICEGNPLGLTSSNNASGQSTGNSYAWSGPSFASTLQNPSVTGSATLSQTGTYTVTITNSFGCTASTSTVVAVNANPTGTAAVTAASCNGLCDGGVVITPTAGQSPYIFTDGVSVNTDGIFTGTYCAGPMSVDVFDDNGCTANIPFSVTEPDVLAISSTTPVDESCAGLNNGSITVAATGGTTSYFYSKDNGSSFQSSNIFNGLAPGNYDIVVKDAHDCITGSSNVTIAPGAPLPSATISGSQNICQPGGSASLSIAFTQAGPWTYSYSDGTSTFGPFSTSGNPETVNVSPASTKTYTVTAVSNGCVGTTTGSAVVTVSTAPPTVNLAFPTVPAYACNGNSFPANTSAVTNTLVYTWDGPAGTTFDAGGNPYSSGGTSVTVNYGAPNGSGYNICVQGSNACGTTTRRCSFVRGTVNVPGVIAPANNRTTECASTSAGYSIAAVTGATGYTWSMTGNATVVGSGTSATVNFGAGWTGGTLSVTANTPCYSSAPRSLALSNATATPGAISGSATACPGSGVTYSVPATGGAATYNWVLPANTTGSSSSNSISVTFLAGFTFGDIKVSITSICGVTSAQQIKTVSSGKPAVPASIAGNIAGLCGQTVVYSCPSVAGASSYTWTSPGTINSGQGSTSINVTFGTFASGNVCVTANNGCGSGTPRCVPLTGKPTAPAVITYSPNPVCANASGVDLQVSPVFGTTGYVWTFPAGVTPVLDLGNEQIVNWGPTGGTVTVTVNNACGNSTKNQTIAIGCRETAPEETAEVKSSTVTVYPNPAHDRITVQFNATEKTSYVLNLMDLSGRVISTATATAQKGINTSEMDLSRLAKGVYMIEVKSDLLNKQIRLVVE